jgi:DNA-binding NtrC family response regulator
MAAPTLHHSKMSSTAEAPSDETHLTVMGANVFETYPLPASGQVSIGRDEEADVRIVDPLASRMHACLHIGPPGKIAVEDLKSANGTFVRGERIDAGVPITLQPGEAVTIGFTHLMVQRRRPRLSARRLRSHASFEECLEEACERASERPGTGPAVIRVRLEDEGSGARGAAVLQGALRSGDLLAQYATGEYEILLLDTDSARVHAIASDIDAGLRRARLAARTAVVAFPTHGRSADALIGQASALLLDPNAEAETMPVLKSPVMRTLYRLAGRAAGGHSGAGLITILVLGETGTGKEVLANWIHRQSPRAAGPFVCINCAALTETLLESELFGHEKGAFTGAGAANPGLLETAAGGTVFLDEIGEMNAAFQTKLLRALETREIMRVGGRVPRAIDVRFIAATNRDLEADVANKAFRQDLFFRLNGISLTIPALRDRSADILPLARHFLSHASQAANRRPPRLSAAAVELLEGYSWPGNIRELRNAIERALVLCEGSEITLAHLPVEKWRLLRMGPEPSSGADGANDVERRRIMEAMVELGGNQTRVAAKLGIARGTLIARLERYGVRRPQSARARGSR